MMYRCCLAFALTMTTTHLAAFAQVQMDWKLKPGDSFNIETVSSSRQLMSTQGKDFQQDIALTTLIACTVKDKTPDGNLVIEQKVESFKAANKAQPSDEKTIEQVRGASWTVVLNPKWEVVKLDGHEELLRRIAGQQKEDHALVAAALTPENMKKSVSEVFAFLPGKPVNPGDKWEAKTEMPLGPLGNLSRSLQYTYEGKGTVDGKPVEKITFTGTAGYAPPKEKRPGVGLHIVRGDLKVEKLAGTIFFDPVQGRLVQAETKLLLKGNLATSVGNQFVDTQVQHELSSRTRVHERKP